MQVAFDRREFSFMLAGVLVASTAAALVFVYCSMNSSLGYLLNLERGNYISYEGPINMGEPVAIADEEFSWLASQPGKIDPD
ncbi:MAG: hypothetical protein ACFCBU_02705 [Cyanophyceae cyanobacterium]